MAGFGSKRPAGNARPAAMKTAQSVLISNTGYIFGTKELKDILAGHEIQLQQKMDEAVDMESFLIELVDTMEVILSSKTLGVGQERPTSYWSHITEQLDRLGWSKVTHLSEDLSQVQIELCDASRRRHILTVSFPPGYPATPLILEPLDIPECESERLSQKLNSEVAASREGSRLDIVVQQAEKQLEVFKDFWDVMQDIDEKTWVIDPEKPTRADRMRRCALGNNRL
ncbi:hypothetical protein BGZ49_006500 [Haplosporangium sp. Z 27]|nr:hypothetical protein BGZ49_006500 [Haplosporangium sp. Z 27]